MKTVTDLIRKHNPLSIALDNPGQIKAIINIAHEFADQFKGWIDASKVQPQNFKHVVAFNSELKMQCTAVYNPEFKSWMDCSSMKIIPVSHFHYQLPDPQ